MTDSKLANLYVSLRDELSKRRAEFTQLEDAIKALQEQIGAEHLGRFNRADLQNQKYKSGVLAYTEEKDVVSTTNSSDFVNWVLQDPEERIHLMQARTSQGKCATHAKKHGPIPGIDIQPVRKMTYKK